MKTNTIKTLGLAAMAALVLASCAETPTGPVKGCMNSAAVNYNPDATEDAGGCVVIPQKQYSLFFKFTATWCGPCGDWGGPAFEEVYNAEKGKILAFTIQTGDDFTTPANDSVKTQFESKWNYGGTPNFVVNNTLLNTSYSGAYSEIETNYSTGQPEAGVGIHYTIGAGPNAGKININAYTKFFQPVVGEYYLGVYILHREIVKNQNVDGTYDPNYVHHHVLMSPVTRVFGNKIASGSTNSGKVINTAFVFPYDNIPDLDITSMEVVGILFKKNGTSYDVVNVTPN